MENMLFVLAVQWPSWKSDPTGWNLT